jgi:molybdate transport system substrate-binding protein
MNFKKVAAMTVILGMTAGLFAGCGSSTEQAASSADGSSAAAASTSTTSVSSASEQADASSVNTVSTSEAGGSDVKTEIHVFIAASLNNVMQEIAQKFNEQYPNVTVTFNADSSGTLMTQIEEGYSCDVFFSAAQKQMDQLEGEGLVVDGTRKDVVNNQVCIITRKDSGTKVTGLDTLKDASSIALADGSVPVGKYTRQALVNAGILAKVDDPSKITTQEISDALGGVEISEQSNVSKVLAAVEEASCEVGTTYYSDTYGQDDQITIIQKIPYDLTGNVLYPIAQIKNDEADAAEQQAAEAFTKFVTSDDMKEVFQKYYFDTDVE